MKLPLRLVGSARRIDSVNHSKLACRAGPGFGLGSWDVVLQFLMMVYAVVVAFVLVSAERNRREMRPHGPALMTAGQVAVLANGTLAVLLAGWAVLYASGYIAELPAI